MSIFEWDCVRHLFNFLLYSGQTDQTLGNKEEQQVKGSIFHRSCVRYLFIFMLFTVQTSQTIGTRKALTLGKVISHIWLLEWDCVRYLFMFLLFTANFIDIRKREKVTWKGIYDLSFRGWDCVRFLFIFLLSSVKNSLTLSNKSELLQMAYLIYQFPNETVTGKVPFSCYYFCSANSCYIWLIISWLSLRQVSVHFAVV